MFGGGAKIMEGTVYTVLYIHHASCFNLKSNMCSHIFNALHSSNPVSLSLVSINKLYPPPAVPCSYMPGCFLCLLAVSSVSVGELTIIFLLSEQFPVIQPTRLTRHCRSSQLSLCLKDKFKYMFRCHTVTVEFYTRMLSI